MSRTAARLARIAFVGVFSLAAATGCARQGSVEGDVFTVGDDGGAELAAGAAVLVVPGSLEAFLQEEEARCTAFRTVHDSLWSARDTLVAGHMKQTEARLRSRRPFTTAELAQRASQQRAEADLDTAILLGANRYLAITESTLHSRADTVVHADAVGHFRLDGLEPGEYIVWATSASGRPYGPRRDWVAPLEIRAGEATRADLGREAWAAGVSLMCGAA